MVVMVPGAPGRLRHIRQFEKHVAGAEFNLAVGLSRLGLSAGWISRVGADEFGAEMLGILRAEQVDVTHVASGPQPTGLYFKEYSGSPEPRVYYYRAGSAASTLDADDIDEAYIKSARVLHITGITPLLSDSCRRAVWKAIEVARGAGVKVSFDPNIRYRLIAPSAVPSFFRPFLEASDLVLAGTAEMAAMLGPDLPPDALELKLLDLGPSLVVVKRGAAGAVARTALERVEGAAWPVSQVVDTVGAGDGFDAGFLAGWLRGWDLRRCLRLANLVGARATGVYGDYEGYPTWPEATAQLEDCLPAER
jgi:2-dehydro-3-deoxygluconokinase